MFIMLKKEDFLKKKVTVSGHLWMDTLTCSENKTIKKVIVAK